MNEQEIQKENQIINKLKSISCPAELSLYHIWKWGYKEGITETNSKWQQAVQKLKELAFCSICGKYECKCVGKTKRRLFDIIDIDKIFGELI